MGKTKVLFVTLVSFALCVTQFAQTRTVTNADLEQFREKRLQAEKELRENYEELGFPSPEELERRNEESRRELSQLARRIREEEAQREAQAAAQYTNGGYYDYGSAYSYPNPGFIDYGQYTAPSYFYGSYRTRGLIRNSGKHREGLNRFRPFFRTLRRLSNQNRTQTRRSPGRARTPTRGGRRN